ncbi:MAG: RHS repeat-associated core domain-containing protein, partial [Planctomycetaceae bacterium]|nr:RHS repeat-associated core domain-containing protein [Planctomycetaceae bacterium]
AIIIVTRRKSLPLPNIPYIIGLYKIAQITVKNGSREELYFTFDGHGSTRVLTDYIGAAIELYSYDAFGNALGFDPSTALTEFLYSGEQFDSKIGQQYLRQRYYDPSTGRFNRLDPFFGNLNDPLSLHKYLYIHSDPINGIDPTGLMMAGMVGTIGNIGSMALGHAQTAFRVYKFVQSVQTIIDLFQLISSLTVGFPAIQQEVMKEIRNAINLGNQSTRFRSISSQDILDCLNKLAQDFIPKIAPLIAGKHGSRIAVALASRQLPKSRQNVIVLYMPGIEGAYTGEKLIKCPGLRFINMDVEISTTRGGGRLVGVGFAESKNQRRDKNESYQIFRVDWHDSRQRHLPPYAEYFKTSSGFEFHWVVPSTITEAKAYSRPRRR